MTTIEEHRKALKGFLEDINEKVKADLIVQRQKIVGFDASEASTNLFAILLHKKNLISPGFNVNHLFFSSLKIAEDKFSFGMPKKEELLKLLVSQESYRDKLCYGKEKESEIIKKAIQNLYQIKKAVEEVIGEEI